MSAWLRGGGPASAALATEGVGPSTPVGLWAVRGPGVGVSCAAEQDSAPHHGAGSASVPDPRVLSASRSEAPHNRRACVADRTAVSSSESGLVSRTWQEPSHVALVRGRTRSATLRPQGRRDPLKGPGRLARAAPVCGALNTRRRSLDVHRPLGHAQPGHVLGEPGRRRVWAWSPDDRADLCPFPVSTSWRDFRVWVLKRQGVNKECGNPTGLRTRIRVEWGHGHKQDQRRQECRPPGFGGRLGRRFRSCRFAFVGGRARG